MRMTHQIQRSAVAAAFLALALISGCGDDVARSLGTDPGRRGGVVTWGNTMMKVEGSGAFRAMLGDSAGNTDDYVLVGNILQHLSGKTSGVRILYTDTCDPRTDPNVCHIGPLDILTPFYNMVASIGTITYGGMSSVQLADYDVVIADFCSLPSQDYDVFRSYLLADGPAMVLADNFCWRGTSSSTASLGNTVMADFGVTFSASELADRGRLQISSAEQSGLLAGVSNLSLWRMTSQVISHGFVPVVTVRRGNPRVGTTEYVLYTIHEGPLTANATAAAPVRGPATSGRPRTEEPAPLGTALAQSLVARLVMEERTLVRTD